MSSDRQGGIFGERFGTLLAHPSLFYFTDKFIKKLIVNL
jgi:hypothetical protein